MSTTAEVAKMETFLKNNLTAFEQQKARVLELQSSLALYDDKAVIRGIKKQIVVHQKLAVAYLQNAQNLQQVLENL